MSERRRRYVVGFAFGLDQVVLIRKLRPTWQRGLLNGPGGLINPGESAVDAMVREFHEECGVPTWLGDWVRFAGLEFPGGWVDFFATHSREAYGQAHTVTDEAVEKVLIANLLTTAQCVSNVRFLVPLALHHGASGSGSRLILPVWFHEELA